MTGLLMLFACSMLELTGADLSDGTRVRVTMRKEAQPPSDARFASHQGAVRIIGTVLDARDKQIELRPDGQSERVTLPVESIAQLEVSRGRKSHPGKGAVIGALAGAAFVGAMCLAEGGCGSKGEMISTEEAVVMSSAMGAGGGALAGLFVRTERWEALPPGRIRLSVLPTPRRGLGLSVTLGF